jgi:hypothetical protein
MNRLRELMLAFGLWAAPQLAGGADGALEINQDCVAAGCFTGDAPGYPVTITVPGTYLLTTDLAPPGSAFVDAISIPQASPVDLDLGGHTISGGSICGGTPVFECTPAEGRSGIQVGGEGQPVALRLHHGRIRGFTEAVSALDLAAGTRFDGLVVTDNLAGLKVEASTPDVDIRIVDSVFARNRFTGIGRYIGDTRIHVENCIVSENGAAGIEAAHGSTFVNNRINRNGDVGITCNFAGGGTCAVGGNTLLGNNGGGASPQWTIPVVRILSGNSCMDDDTCP